LFIGGALLARPALLFPAHRLGLGTSLFGLRLLGGVAIGAVLLLPAAVRPATAPLIPGGLAMAGVVVSIGEELAFRGALYAALEEVGGAPLAVLGSTVLWTLAHVLSHPLEFLGAVAMAGLLLALWRWACKDLVGPMVGHVLADLAL
jgi:membrane protease YdiL (CAAX protease family)